MTHHPLTDQGIEKFKKDYIKVLANSKMKEKALLLT